MTDNHLDSLGNQSGQTHTEASPVARNPEVAVGQNFDHVSPQPEKPNPRTAYDEKEARRQLLDWQDEELKQVPLLAVGAQLEHGATYVDLREPARREFTATGEMKVPIDGLYVPRSEVDDRTWNRLLGNRTPEKIVATGNPSG